MIISKHELLHNLKWFYNTKNHIPQCLMVNCQDCSVSEECTKLDKALEVVFGEKKESFIEVNMNEKAKNEIEEDLQKFFKSQWKEYTSEKKEDIFLSKEDFICIARHIKRYTDIHYKRKIDVPEPCEQCGKHCKFSGTSTVITNPWIAFKKLGLITGIQLNPYI